MAEYFDIYGTPISFSTIKDFRIIQQEYIYRPIYTVTIEKGILGFSKGGKKYTFHHMEPYAAIVSERGFSSATEKYKTKTFFESVGKDLVGAVGIATDRVRSKTIRKKYTLRNSAGRVFSCYLDEIPILVMDEATGKATDLYRHDPEYLQLVDNPVPAINIIHALKIVSDKEEYIFYGNGIQLEDVGKEYERLKAAMEEYKVQKKGAGTKIGSPKSGVSLPKISIPLLGKKSKESSEQVLTDLKKQFVAGELSEEQYRAAVDEVLEKL